MFEVMGINVKEQNGYQMLNISQNYQRRWKHEYDIGTHSYKI